MPFRTKETLEAWVAEFSGAAADCVAVVEVLVHVGDPGEDTGLIVVRLHNATTDVHLAPAAPGSPTWEVTFGPREGFFSLDTAALRSLSAELALAAELCAFLETKSLEALHALAQPTPLPGPASTQPAAPDLVSPARASTQQAAPDLVSPGVDSTGLVAEAS